MPRNSRVYLDDILGAIGKIKRYTEELSKQAFAEDEKTLDAVVRNLEVIGEAVKRLPDELRAREPGVDWAKIGASATSIHQYSGSTWTAIDRPGRRPAWPASLQGLPSRLELGGLAGGGSAPLCGGPPRRGSDGSAALGLADRARPRGLRGPPPLLDRRVVPTEMAGPW
jgi:uncharacterized protein with HEPN domain